MGRTQAERSINANNTYDIDTQGICFLCLRLKENARVEAAAVETTTTHSFQKLSRFLDVDYHKIFNISVPLQSSNGLNEAELLVTLCDSCSLEANRFLQLYQELEEVLMKVNGCVRNMHRIMHLADCNPILVQQYRERMITANANPVALIQASITENFRKELKGKCLHNCNPQRANLKDLSFSTQKPVPQLMSLQTPTQGYGSQRNSSFRKRPYNYQSVPPAAANHAQYLDLDKDSRSDSPPPPIISSVSGAGGSHYDSTAPPSSSDNELNFGQPPAETNSLKEADSFLESIFSLPPQPPSRLDKPSKESSEMWFDVGDGRLQCRTCGKFLLKKNNTDNILNHERMHNGTKPIQCNLCPERFRNNWTLRFHFIANHRAELLGRFRKESVSLEAFKKVVEYVIRDDCKREVGINGCEGTRFVCVYCGKSLGRKPDVESHLIQYHSDDVGKKLTAIQNDPTVFNAIRTEHLVTLDTGSLPFAPAHPPSLTTLYQNVIPTQPQLPTPAPLVTQQTPPPPPSPSSYPISEITSGSITVSTTTYPIPATTASASSSKSTSSRSQAQSSNRVHNVHLKCNLCGKFFAGIQLLKKHKLSVHPITPGSVFPTGSGMTITPIKAVNSSTPATLPKMKPPNILAKPRLSQQQENVARPTKKYPCSFCKTTFRFYSTYRIHQLNVHRLEMFAKHLVEGTTLEDINEVMVPLLGDWRPMANGNRGCKFCDRLFTPNEVELSQLRNHMLLSHFEELVVKMQHGIAEKKAKKTNVDEGPVLTRSELIVKKEEDDDVIEILPD